jgi:hypothetical protein
VDGLERRRSTAELSTELLRTSDDWLYVRLRQLLPEHGVDVASDVLADLFPDDVDQGFGVMVTADRRVFTFVFHYGRKGDLKTRAATGFLWDWTDLTSRWQSSPYDGQVREALGLLGAR